MSFKKAIELLKNTKVEKIAPKAADIMTISIDATVREGLKLLMDKKILSVPVVDGGKPCGYVDVLDIVHFVVDIFKGVRESKSEESIYNRLSSGTKFGNAKIRQLKKWGVGDKVWEVKQGASVFSVLEIFVKENAHRVFIRDTDGKFISMLTQSAVLKFVCENPKTFLSEGSFGELAVQDLPKLGTSPVFCVHKDTKTIEAFIAMQNRSFSGLGITDNEGRLIGNVSARDLEWIDERHFFSNLVMSVGKFIQAIRLSVIDESAPVISCREETKLSYIVRRLVGNRVHRIYVVDKDLKPLRIVSLRDMLCLFV